MISFKHSLRPNEAVRFGLTLTEVLVSLAIIGLLLALVLPATQMSRESARRIHCANNLHQIGVALQNYESTYGMYPTVSSRLASWHVTLLPQIERTDLFQQVDYSMKEPAALIAAVRIELYVCPSDPAPAVFSQAVTVAATNYLGNSGTGVLVNGYNGMFAHFKPAQPDQYPEGPIRAAAITDGSSSTAAVSEVLHSLGGVPRERLRVVWNTPEGYTNDQVESFKSVCDDIPIDPIGSGWKGSPIAHGWRWTFGEIGYSTYNHMLTPGKPSCFNATAVQTGIYTAASQHASIANTLFADGHVRGISNQISSDVWVGIGSRNGSETISDF